ncbi:permease, partial [Vibrio parahaemolyticus]
MKASYYLYPSSPTTELYDPKTFFTHAALLHQTCVHCGRFPTAASHRLI